MEGKIIASRYKLLEQKSQDAICTIYEAQDQTDKKTVTVKVFSEKIRHMSLERLLRFKREIERVSKATHDNLLKILEYGEHEGQQYLVTEHINGAQSVTDYIKAAPDVEKAAGIMLQVCAGLTTAHEGGVIHQSLNPSSVLVFQDGKGPTAKIKDFGIGLLLDLAGIKEEDEVIKTFGYMSPEATGILRKPIDERSDIYSLGIIFYQLLTGRLPYEGRDVSTLIHQHIAQKPPLPTKANPSIPPVIEKIVLRLIAKDPLDRYQTVLGLYVDLQEYLRRRAKGEPTEFEIARSDRLKELTYTTRLIGRDREYGSLKEVVDKSKTGRGSLCLVYGDPGVGKSRLVDEMRGYVHSIGGMFVGGRGYQYEVATPYKVFSEALESYVDKLKRVSSEQRKATIKRIKESIGDLGAEVVMLAPSIVDVIGEQPKLEALDPAKERIRFLMTVSKFVSGLGTKESPFVIFLDDLQWTDEGSVELLERVAEGIGPYPITVIASYRDREVTKDHPLTQAIARLKEKNIFITDILVKPFVIEETSRILSEILLEEEESILPLANELHHRTNGNVFFVLELLRSLVDQAIVYFEDNHYHYDSSKLKDAILPTDIVEVVIKRVEEVSEENQRILCYASLIGKEIDLEFLSDLTNIPYESVLNILEEGIENQFLVRDITGKETVSFVHERIREAFCVRLSESERISLHSQIGNLLEEKNKDNLESVLYDLAYHFARARIEDKTLRYSLQAAKKAQAAYAHDQVISLYEEARGILERQNKTTLPEYIDILQNIGLVYRWAGKFDRSLEALQRCESLIPDKDRLVKAHVLSMMGDTLWDNGEIGKTEEILERALKLLGARVPKTLPGLGLAISKQFIVQELHALLPSIFVKKEYTKDPKTEVVVRIFFRLGYAHYFTNVFKMVYSIMKGRNLADKLGPCRLLSTFNSQVGMVWYNMTMGYFARRHLALGKKIAEDLNDKLALGIAYQYHGTSLYEFKPWESNELALKCIEILKGVGEVWEMLVAMAFRTFNGLVIGKNFNEYLEDTEDMLATAQSVNALQPLAWSYMHKAKGYAFIGDERLKTEGIKAAEDGIRTSDRIGDKGANLWAYAVSPLPSWNMRTLDGFRD